MIGTEPRPATGPRRSGRRAPRAGKARLTGPAEALGWSGVEMCVPGGAEPSGWEKLVFAAPGQLNGSPEARLFRYWSFPVIDVTKEQMRDIARENGFYGLLLQRWFCFDPLLGRPCGRCHPCSLALHDELTFARPTVVRARTAARRVRRIFAAVHAEGAVARRDAGTRVG